MKQFNNALALFMCMGFFFTACEKESIKISKENVFDVPFKSSVNEQILLKNKTSQIVLQVKSITDNRCKENHEFCPNPGTATVRLELSNLSNSKAESMLHLGLFDDENKDADSVMIYLDGKPFLVSLHSVDAESSNHTKIQTAEFCVKSQ